MVNLSQDKGTTSPCSIFQSFFQLMIDCFFFLAKLELRAFRPPKTRSRFFFFFFPDHRQKNRVRMPLSRWVNFFSLYLELGRELSCFLFPFT